MRFSIVYLFLFPLFGYSQDLVVNGGFEEENICTEYDMNCAPEGWVSSLNGFDNYFKDPVKAHGGAHCMSVIAGHAHKKYYRTYIRTQLLCRLHKGIQYKLEFFIRSVHPVLDSIGVYFTVKDFLYSNDALQNIAPSFYLINGTQIPVINDTSWQKVSMIYKATGNENFLIIGNFSKADLTGPTNLHLENNYLLFIDDVSLTPVDQDMVLCADWKETKQQIYDFNIRHRFLERFIKEHRNDQLPDINEAGNVHIDTLVLPDILFESGKASLARKSYSYLDSICKNFGHNLIDSVVVEGHTDNTGLLSYNRKLSITRANTIADYMKNRLTGLPFITRGWADEKPVADNKILTGREKNRRVAIYLYVRQ
jgi:outer membrane protein OmpA-like peptidoglycan-associated protein